MQNHLTNYDNSSTGAGSLWKAFLHKGRLESGGETLETIVSYLQEFLMPLTIAAANDISFEKQWKRVTGWQMNNVQEV
jgi:hypothetical protein